MSDVQEFTTKKRKLDCNEEINNSNQINHHISEESNNVLNAIVNDGHSGNIKEDTRTDRQVLKANCKFIYGNYEKYYGYRNKDKDYQDVRLDIFKQYEELFDHKDVLDIGCNNGFITMEIAQRFKLKSIIGIDIDRKLIETARKNLIKHKKLLPWNNEYRHKQQFPYNVIFVHGNYVLRDDVLLEIEKPQFDLIMALSITKWIHINFGDAGLQQSFRRMYQQLRPQGKLVLEAQPFHTYRKRKHLTESIFVNYTNIKLFPKDFNNYLLSHQVGFKRVELMGIPDQCVNGFKRPIYVFYKD